MTAQTSTRPSAPETTSELREAGTEHPAAPATVNDHMRSFVSTSRVQGARMRVDLTEVPFVGSSTFDADTLATIAALVEAYLERQGERADGTEWFWRIVDGFGLGNVPSDEIAALRLLCDRAAKHEETTARSEAIRSGLAKMAALARRSAPATGGAARLDREAVARLLWSDENELRFHTPWSEARKDFYCAPESTMGITVGRTYKKADDILALDPVPQFHAASESDDRLWWFLHIIDASGGNAYAGDDKWNWINAFCDDRSGDVDTFNVARDRKLTRVEHDNRTEDSVVYITDAGRKYVAAITPAGRGADAGGWRPIETAAARDVLAERQRQVEAENWTPEHDDTHAKGELAIAAACYATAPPAIYAEREWMFPDRPKSWPWHPSWWKPNFYRRNLVKAGALILAEIERLDRAAAPTAQGEA